MESLVESRDGVRLATRTCGEGPGLVIVHGSGGDSGTVSGLADCLSDDFRITVYDRRGRGSSGDRERYELEQEVADLLAVMATLPELPAALGISYGGLILLDAIARGVGLMGAVLFEPPLQAEPDLEKAAVTRELVQLVADGRIEEAVVNHLMHLHGRSREETRALEGMPEWSRRMENAAVTMREMRTVHADYTLDLETLHAPAYPVHLIEGSATLPFIAQACSAIRALSFVTHHLLEGQDHGAAQTNPSLVAAIVRGAFA